MCLFEILLYIDMSLLSFVLLLSMSGHFLIIRRFGSFQKIGTPISAIFQLNLATDVFRFNRITESNTLIILTYKYNYNKKVMISG